MQSFPCKCGTLEVNFPPIFLWLSFISPTAQKPKLSFTKMCPIPEPWLPLWGYTVCHCLPPAVPLHQPGGNWHLCPFRKTGSTKYLVVTYPRESAINGQHDRLGSTTDCSTTSHLTLFSIMTELVVPLGWQDWKLKYKIKLIFLKEKKWTCFFYTCVWFCSLMYTFNRVHM